MIPTIRFGRLYNYKKIYGKVYIVCLDNGKIIWVRDVRFYERSVFGGSVEKKALFKVVFDEEIEELIFRTIRFKTTLGSSKSPALQVLITLRF